MLLRGSLGSWEASQGFPHRGQLEVAACVTTSCLRATFFSVDGVHCFPTYKHSDVALRCPLSHEAVAAFSPRACCHTS